MPFATRWLLFTMLGMLLAACSPELLPPEDPLQEESAPPAQATPQATQAAAPVTPDRPGAPTSAAEPAPGQPAEDFPSAVQAAIRSLTQLLSVQPSQVEVVSAERTMWRDSCLGLATAGEMCLQVITPGYRVILQVGEKKYEIHTDERGEKLRHVT